MTYKNDIQIPQLEHTWECIDRFKVNGSLGEPGVSYHGPLTKIKPFASVLGELGSLVTNCSWGLWANKDNRPQCASFKV